MKIRPRVSKMDMIYSPQCDDTSWSVPRNWSQQFIQPPWNKASTKSIPVACRQICKYLKNIKRINTTARYIYLWFIQWVCQKPRMVDDWRPTANLEDQVPVFMSPSDRVAQLYTPGTGFHFLRLLRLAGLRWGYSNPPPQRTQKTLITWNVVFGVRLLVSELNEQEYQCETYNNRERIWNIYVHLLRYRRLQSR
jgi:hypothetical protein